MHSTSMPESGNAAISSSGVVVASPDHIVCVWPSMRIDRFLHLVLETQQRSPDLYAGTTRVEINSSLTTDGCENAERRVSQEFPRQPRPGAASPPHTETGEPSSQGRADSCRVGGR